MAFAMKVLARVLRHATLSGGPTRNRMKAVWQQSQGHRAFVEMLRDLHQRSAEVTDAIEIAKARWIAVEKIAETAMRADYYGEN